MSKITPLDHLFVTVSQRGVNRWNLELTGITSLNDIVMQMRNHIPGLNGLTNITVRNATEGWCAASTVLVR